MNLIAYYEPETPVISDAPYAVCWDDGSEATFFDFLRHRLDTHRYDFDLPWLIVRKIYPDVVAMIRWDYLNQDWRVSGCQITAFCLGLQNPDAIDDEIVIALHNQFPTIYRCEIVRGSCSARYPAEFFQKPGTDEEDIFF